MQLLFQTCYRLQLMIKNQVFFFKFNCFTTTGVSSKCSNTQCSRADSIKANQRSAISKLIVELSFVRIFMIAFNGRFLISMSCLHCRSFADDVLLTVPLYPTMVMIMRSGYVTSVMCTESTRFIWTTALQPAITQLQVVLRLGDCYIIIIYSLQFSDSRD